MSRIVPVRLTLYNGTESVCLQSVSRRMRCAVRAVDLKRNVCPLTVNRRRPAAWLNNQKAPPRSAHVRYKTRLPFPVMRASQCTESAGSRYGPFAATAIDQSLRV